MGGQVIRELDRSEDLFLLRAQIIGVEGNGLLHRGQRQQLQQVVLDDVAGRAHAVVIPGAATRTDVLGHGDLDVVHIVRVPQRLEQLVRETQRQDVLDRFLTQVVVDPEHRIRREHRLHNVVQLPGGLQVMPERLLDHHPPPLLALSLRQAVLGQLPADLLKRLRRNGQIERVITPRSALLIQLSDRVTQPLKGIIVVELALHKADTLGELIPHRLIKRRPRIRPHGGLHLGRELLVVPGAAAETHQRETRRQQAPVREVVHGRHELLAGKVTGHPEEHQRGRTGDPVQAAIPRVPERITP